MRHTGRRSIGVAIFGIGLGVFLVSSGRAQARHDMDLHDTDLKVGGIGVSRDLAVNGRYLREAIALGQDALARLQGPGSTAELASTHKTMDLMYRTVRTALWGLRERRRTLRFEEPLLDYEIQRTEKAWNTIRWPVDTYFDSVPTDVYIERSIRELQAAITLLRPVAAVLP